MDFNLSEEQVALQDSLRRYLSKTYALEQRRRIAAEAPGHSAAAWAAYAEMGLLALPFPEDAGGLGGNAVDAGLVMQALGSVLALEPYLASVVLCGRLLLECAGSPEGGAARHMIESVAQGRLLVAFAHHEPRMRHSVEGIAMRAAASGDAWALSGRKQAVLGGAAADRFIVSARVADGADGLALLVVERAAPGLSVVTRHLHDSSLAADLHFEDVRVGLEARLATGDAARAAIERAFDHANAALCAEAVGIMQALVDATLAYVKTRHQFGVAIGSFQAIQHRLADMAIATEQSRSIATLAALRLAGDDRAEATRTVAGAKAYVAESARFVGQQAVQLHGGMGMTDELAVSHLFKRLTLIAATFGDADHHLARFARLMTD